MKQYTPVIGLEIHVELKTKSKMFCRCSADYFGQEPNSHVCPVCLGLPGALPVPNKLAIEWTIKIGRALHCRINKISKFDRKHYSYPDLPKGYQISQYDEPIAVQGYLEFEPNYGTYKNEKRKFRIHRVHLEEDTGKLTHEGGDTLIDFNRSSVPLVEIVTEPDFTSADDVKMFLEELHTIIRHLEVSDADMEKGSMRMEPNISLRVKGETDLPKYKVEVKNINSFNFVKKAIDFEAKRHANILDKGKMPEQETRGFDSNKGITYSQRSKEDAHDYRYFPEPDIPAMEFADSYIATIEKTIPLLPSERTAEYIAKGGIKPMDAYNLSRERDFAELYEKVLEEASIRDGKIAPQVVANYFINKLHNKMPAGKTSSQLAEELYKAVKQKENAKNVSIPDELIQKVIAENPKVVTDYKSGKQGAIMFFVGQIMREMKGKADANVVLTRLKEALK